MSVISSRFQIGDIFKRLSAPPIDNVPTPSVEAANKASFSKAVDVIESTQINLYGNCGGPGSERGHHNMGKPIDDLDAAFCKHDRAYAKNGYFDLGADLTLIKDATGVLFSKEAPVTERLAAAATVVFFGGVVTPFISAPTTAYRTFAPAVGSVVSNTGNAIAGGFKTAASWVGF